MTEPIRVALVDDHRMILGALTEWIRSAADDIEMVAAVPTWPELLTHPGFPVDVVLLDLDLKDNIPVAVKISALKSTGVRVVLMSTYSEPNVVREALAAGALGYLVKSEDAAMIVEAIRAAAQGESFISAELDLAINAADIGGALGWIARLGVPIAAALMSAGFFLSSIGHGRTQPNGLMAMVWLGAASLGAGVVTLGIGLLAT